MIKGLTKFSKGFTLIELLVVIAIIGILAGIVLASLGTARSKGSDASAKESLSSLRTAAEVYYGGTGASTYGTVGANTTTSGGTVTGTTPLCIDSTVAPLVTAVAKNSGNTTNCTVGVNGATYEVDTTLSDATIFCVDSNGFSGKPSGTPSRTTTAIVKCQ